MTGFDVDWLALREPADLRARDKKLATRFGETVAALSGAPTILDLGCGTGATVRALEPVVPETARWHLVDNDPALLEVAQNAVPRAEFERTDIAADLDVIDRIAPQAVTASALFDLVSAVWIERFAAKAAQNRAVVYVALTYDGRDRWSPPHPVDDTIRAAFHADMRRDKGFGPSLGTDASQALEAALRTVGYRVFAAASPWRLGTEDRALIATLADGMASVLGANIADPQLMADWHRSRRSADRVVIGHTDILALPPT